MNQLKRVSLKNTVDYIQSPRLFITHLPTVIPFTVLLIVFLLSASKAAELCGRCMPNLAYCINETHFFFCPNGKDALSETAHQCNNDEVCTSTENICVKRSQADPETIACKAECNTCPPTAERNNKFSCASSTQYVICNNGKLTDLIGSCRSGEYCNVELYRQQDSICAPECVLNFFGYKSSCGNEVATSTIAPTVPTPAPNPDALKQQCVSNTPSPYNGYFYIRNRNDSHCKTYIYCEIISNEMYLILLNCNAKFYNEDTKTCVDKKPRSCDEISGPEK